MLSRVKFLILAGLLGLSGLCARAQTTVVSTNNIYFNVGNLVQTPSALYSVTIQGLYGMYYNGTYYAGATPATAGRYNQPQITNGVVWFTNVICGVPFKLTISSYATTITNFCVPATANPDSSGGINAGQYIGYSPGYQQPFWYSSAVFTNYVYTSSVLTNLTWGVQTNLSDSTNHLQIHYVFTNGVPWFSEITTNP